MIRALTAVLVAFLAANFAAAAGAATAAAADTPTLPVGAAAPREPAAATPKAGRVAMHAARRHAEHDRDTAALNLLSANGYTGLTDFRADGLVFVAKAQHDGKPVTVMVDPDTGVIAPIG